MSLSGKKLGLLLSAAPDQDNFNHALNLAEAALARGLRVYLYCLDEAVRGLKHPRIDELRQRGLILYACAYGAQKRSLPSNADVVYAGLGVLSDILFGTDRFLSFN